MITNVGSAIKIDTAKVNKIQSVTTAATITAVICIGCEYIYTDFQR